MNVGKLPWSRKAGMGISSVGLDGFEIHARESRSDSISISSYTKAYIRNLEKRY